MIEMKSRSKSDRAENRRINRVVGNNKDIFNSAVELLVLHLNLILTL